MKIVENVFEIAESFIKSPTYVQLNESSINKLGEWIKNSKKPSFYSPNQKNTDVFKGIILELVGSSVNYCYWYGRHDIRPNEANSGLLYELMINSFFDFDCPSYDKLSECIERFIKVLSKHRFPLIEDRVRHLRELKLNAIEFAINIENRYNVGIDYDINMSYLMSYLIENFPGFASDIFLKRASLFFLQLFRRFNWFDDELYSLHVPADYQIPKMLRYFNCINYSESLTQMINNHQLIPKHSQIECEIRSATILTIKKLCEISEWNVAEVDAFLFLKRGECKDPFHLTITTDY